MIERVVVWLLEVLPYHVGRFVAWLRRPRFKKRGTLREVLVTREGVAVPSLRQVPLRSSKADSKRAALAWARQHWHDPSLTWGQARKRIRKLEGRLRTAEHSEAVEAAIEAAREIAIDRMWARGVWVLCGWALLFLIFDNNAWGSPS